MALVKDKPVELQPENDLDNIVDPEASFETAPAYLAFGTTPCAMANPPEIDECETYLVRVRCTGTSTSERTDGEIRHGRKLTIQWCVKKGQPEPPDPDGPQPGLFDTDGQPSDEAMGEPVGEAFDGLDEFAAVRPEFSDKDK